MKAYAPPIKPYASHDQTELRRLLAIDAAAYWKRAKETPSQEFMVQDNIRRRKEIAARLGVDTRRTQDERISMDAEVLGLISAGAETIADIWYLMAGSEVKRPSVERAVAALCADGRIQAGGRTKSGARIWAVAA